MKEEIEVFLRRLTNLRSADLPQIHAYQGTYRGQRMVMGVIGEGERKAARSTQRLIQVFQPNRLILVGTAGALAAQYRVGDVFAVNKVLRVDGDNNATATFVSREGNTRGDSETLTDFPRTGCATLSHIVTSPREKSSLYMRFREEQVTLVDMESAAFVDEAKRAKIPWTILRAVSDTASSALPSFLATCRDREGGIDRAAIVRHAMLQPRAWGTLLQGKKHVDLCAIRLADALAAFL